MHARSYTVANYKPTNKSFIIMSAMLQHIVSFSNMELC